MNRNDVKAYLERDWAAVGRLKRQYWADEKRRMTPEEAFGVADALRRAVHRLRPDWPDQAQRANDLRAHIRLSELLRRVPYPIGH